MPHIILQDTLKLEFEINWKNRTTGYIRNNSHILKGNKSQTKKGTQKFLLLKKHI